MLSINKHLSFIFLVLSATCIKSYAQKTEFEISLPEKHTDGAKYGKFRFVDQRGSSMFMGFVQTGALNRKSLVVEKDPLEQQLSKVFDALADKTKDGELLLQLRYCNFSEHTGSFSENGYFALRANLYAKKDDLYQSLLSIDTVISVSAMDVTNRLLRTGGETLINFIDSGLTIDPKGRIYSFNDIVKIDSIQKSVQALYNSSTLKDGLYSTSQAFFTQQPDVQIINAENKVNSIVVYINNEKGKKIKVKPAKQYAVVYQGEAYISYNNNFYKIIRQGDDFVSSFGVPLGTDPFTGAFVVSTTYGMIGGMTGGLIGAAVGSAFDAAAAPSVHGLSLKLDYVTGKLMTLY